ncbi:hypothetical protein GY296_004903 [Salmonella enterica]|nr:hypothetical protein [Salmonella enterica]
MLMNRGICHFFTLLRILPFFGSQKWRRGIIAAWTQKTSNCCDEWTIAP